MAAAGSVIDHYEVFDEAITPKVLHALKLHRLHIALVQDKLVVLCHMLDMDIGNWATSLPQKTFLNKIITIPFVFSNTYGCAWVPKIEFLKTNSVL